MSDHADPATGAFVAHRNLLFTVAYEMLGSAADAEDVLQETWLRWVEVDLETVRDRRAYLIRITTRQSLNRLRTMNRRKEAYVDVSYDEIAAAVDRNPAAVRQIAHRARQHVRTRRPRTTVPPGRARAALASFQRALETRDFQGLLDVLAPDLVLVADGGGVKRAALRPVAGADKVIRMLVGGLGRTEAAVTGDPTVVNGGPALLIRLDGELDGVLAIRVEDARITGLYYVRNPAKLTRMGSETPLTLR